MTMTSQVEMMQQMMQLFDAFLQQQQVTYEQFGLNQIDLLQVFAQSEAEIKQAKVNEAVEEALDKIYAERCTFDGYDSDGYLACYRTEMKLMGISTKHMIKEFDRVKEFCIKKRYKWSDCLAKSTCKESEYYEDLMNYLRKNLALFPYHLAEYVCRIQRISPFRYYCDILYEVMKNERPYDTIPNFTAADALRLTGIGRNEFLDIMNKCRAKRLMWKLNKSIIKEMMPTQPVTFTIESWWTVCVVNLSLEEFRKLTEDEIVVIDKICKEEVNIFGLLDPDVVRGLYRRGLVYVDVLIFPDDYFKGSLKEHFCVLKFRTAAEQKDVTAAV
ncbi:hypothetical protein L7F22_024559 [Adiantum nelumboides]|nr:hypothetical protein [Adiantum nelumboides]